MKKRILVVVPAWNLGGTEIVNVAIANKLSEKNQVAIFTLATPQNKNLHTECPLDGQSDFSLKVFSRVSSLLGLLHLNPLARLWMSKKAKEISKICQKDMIDTVIISSDFIYLIPFLKHQNPEIKFIAWCHFSAKTYQEKPFRYTAKFWREGFAMTDEAVCLTPEDRDIFLKINKKTRVINNPLVFKNTQVSDLTSKVISWTGRIANPQKGIDYLAQVAGKLPKGWKISVAGNGNMKEFQTYLSENDAEERVILQGSLSGEKLRNHYLNSSIYLMTSRFEGLGLVLLEAMSFGLPIVAFEQSGSRYALDYGKNGILIENGNVEEMVRQLTNLINDFEERKNYQEKSLERLKEFTIDRVAQEWENII